MPYWIKRRKKIPAHPVDTGSGSCFLILHHRLLGAILPTHESQLAEISQSISNYANRTMNRIPSETLRTFFNECSISLEVEMMNRFKVMGAKFCQHLSAKVGGNKAREHLRQSELLYLKVLDKIINLKRTSSAPISGRNNYIQFMITLLIKTSHCL